MYHIKKQKVTNVLQWQLYKTAFQSKAGHLQTGYTYRLSFTWSAHQKFEA